MVESAPPPLLAGRRFVSKSGDELWSPLVEKKKEKERHPSPYPLFFFFLSSPLVLRPIIQLT